ncbi:STAS domain-containing protein [Modestobacter sp. I12A-02662]|uniref:STAS domain-containing protein n=1 Tax=Modestobacter sp. I12A-02662 TaxID=1730496 RepID=UPI0034DF1005
MQEPTAGNDAPESSGSTPEITVTTTQDGHSAEIRVVGELTEEARRPLVRVMTDLMLASHQLRRVELDLSGVDYMNSAGVSTLVQLERMAEPRGIEMPLIVATTGVTRPLQVSGLWRRFTIVDRREGTPQRTREPMRPGIEHR